MNKARELLKIFMHELTKDELCSVSEELQAKIEELLAQPELREEPVAWMYDTYEEGYREKYDCLTTIEDYISNTGVTNVRPLYTSPPKREPLSDDAMMHRAMVHNYHAPSAYCRGFRDAEKQHGIGVKDE